MNRSRSRNHQSLDLRDGGKAQDGGERRPLSPIAIDAIGALDDRISSGKHRHCFSHAIGGQFGIVFEWERAK
jgi:hypothetical protein